MLVEIAASRCPPASGVLLATGCASTSAAPSSAGLAGPGWSVVSFLLPGLWGAKPRNRRAPKTGVRARRPFKARAINKLAEQIGRRSSMGHSGAAPAARACGIFW
ncbi:MAG TPA: hypothetical protein VGX51_06350 [Solirubrobacteraceae bacterium]|jgi:hypothetical protein|nr:hypothetical protein [Solirubrobacteraceae bacterium]